MGLVMLCGPGVSGKSRLASELCAALDGARLISEEAEARRSREETYGESGAGAEKELRGLLRSAVERELSNGALVVLDSPAYVKSFRYELFTIAKQASTHHLCLLCQAEASTSRRLNAERPMEQRYSEATLDGLRARFEPPSPQNRWDSPLVVFDLDKALAEGSTETAQTLARVGQILAQSPGLKPNVSVQSVPKPSADFVSALETGTKEMVKEILAAQASALPGDEIPIGGAEERLRQPWQKLSMAQLSRLRRHFLSFAKERPTTADAVPALFVAFLNAQLQAL